ncbi:hypothetical protein AOQ84DRAFT_225354 [Glonium stellatum]|uniref:Uncharacterized protein n=1 Tax=Glonium stellatum TaxID=574774 RepID=A0A8E2JXP7_9PEZI|nr:hypothetical protein AOQ84DRAFT_225354 [Glonium stellatum]
MLSISFLQSTFVLLLALALASASPTPRFSKRDNSGVYVCSDVNWGGDCVHYVQAVGGNDCIKLDGTASSIGPDPGFSCTFYKNVFCDDLGDGTLNLEYPGDSSMPDGWNDAVYSFVCVDNTQG